MTSADIQRGIVIALSTYDQGRQDMFQVATAINQAPFRVRAELKALKRSRLVAEEIAPEGHLWSLTARGWAAYYAVLQMTTKGAA